MNFLFPQARTRTLGDVANTWHGHDANTVGRQPQAPTSVPDAMDYFGSLFPSAPKRTALALPLRAAAQASRILLMVPCPIQPRCRLHTTPPSRHPYGTAISYCQMRPRRRATPCRPLAILYRPLSTPSRCIANPHCRLIILYYRLYIPSRNCKLLLCHGGPQLRLYWPCCMKVLSAVCGSRAVWPPPGPGTDLQSLPQSHTPAAIWRCHIAVP